MTAEMKFTETDFSQQGLDPLIFDTHLSKHPGISLQDK
jgi:hypothetical protein